MPPNPESDKADSGEAEKFLQNGGKDGEEKKLGEDLEVEVKEGNNSNDSNSSSSNDRKCCSLKCVLLSLGVLAGLLALVALAGYITYKTKYEGTAEEASPEEITGVLRQVEAEGGMQRSGAFNISGK